MPMSEAKRVTPSAPRGLAHAGEVAQWTVLLLGWLWLGEQGMRLGWSMASGVLAVAVWWTVRIVLRGSTWAFQCAPAVMGFCGLLTAWGVFMPELLVNPAAAHACLLGLAVVWGLWSALMETRTQVSTFQLAPMAWHPLLAAGLVVGAWHMPGVQQFAPLGTGLLLALCALILYMRDRCQALRAPQCRGPRASLPNLLAPSAMGVMMGSLWLGNAWCDSLGISTDQRVVAHLVLMAGLPALMDWVLRLPGPSKLPGMPDLRTSAGLGLLALGTPLFLGDSPVHSVLAMLLPSLAWAVHCSRYRTPQGLAGAVSSRPTKSLAVLLGPVLLVLVGVASPLHGPAALQSALSLLGGLVAWHLVHVWRRMQAASNALSVT